MATVITPVWQGCQWCQDLLHLTTKPPVPIPNTLESFSWTGDLLEPLHNHWWHWAAFRICGHTEWKAGPQQH